MAALNFDACMAQVARWEGWRQFSNDPHDPGGATYSGVTQRAYDGWRRSKGLFLASVAKAPDDEIKAIYRTQYWDVLRCDDLPKGLDCIVFSTGVNMGTGQAAKFLQRALQVTADGQIGLETLNAVHKSGSAKYLIQSVASQRLAFWRRLKQWIYFGKGWKNRGDDDDRIALAMAA